MTLARVMWVVLALAASGVWGRAWAQDAMPDEGTLPPGLKPSAAKPELPPEPLPEGAGDISTTWVTLGGLDKLTARVVTIETEVGQTTRFGTLEIIARACRQHRPEESPENAAFLDIWDIKTGLPAQSVFRGWMFSSTPALSAMEHPIFDIWVLSCHNGRR